MRGEAIISTLPYQVKHTNITHRHKPFPYLFNQTLDISQHRKYFAISPVVFPNYNKTNTAIFCHLVCLSDYAFIINKIKILLNIINTGTSSVELWCSGLPVIIQCDGDNLRLIGSTFIYNDTAHNYNKAEEIPPKSRLK